MPGARSPLANPRTATIDVVLIRKQTEGLFSARQQRDADPDSASDVMKITRAGAARLFDFAVDLTRRRKAAGHAGRLTLIDKSNVLNSMAFFREVFDQRLAPMAISAVTMSMSTPPPSTWCARLGIMT